MGSIDRYTKRCIKAILSLKDDAIFWPRKQEKQLIKSRIKKNFHFSGCIRYIIDGTLIPLFNKPVNHGSDYYSHKGSYGITAPVVCDDMKRIRHALIGYPGGAHDHRILYETSLCDRPGRYFKGSEYLLGDFEFTADPILMSSFKGNNGKGRNEDEAMFHIRVKKARFAIENYFAALKGRFQSLRDMRKIIRNEKDAKGFDEWFRCCCILHNLLIADVDDWVEEELGKENSEAELREALFNSTPEDPQDKQTRELAGKQKRIRLMNIVNRLPLPEK